MNKGVALVLSFLTVCSVAESQEQQQTARQIKYPVQYWGDTELYLDKQHEEMLAHVENILAVNPPQIPEPLVRKSALYLVDAVLHDVKAPERPSVQAFHHRRMEAVLKELETTKVTDGAVIWKLYDLGFIVRTKSVTLAFDFIRGHSSKVEEFAIADDLAQKIADQCDILFISHLHGDHADEVIAGMFLDAGKKVIAPENLWEDQPIHERLTFLERAADTVHDVELTDGKKLDVVVFPGHQGDLLNNVSLVTTPEGMGFCQTGDQANDGDFAWIDEAGKNYRVDVLMPNCWTTDMPRLAEGLDPVLVIPGHENELGHTIDHREPYWLTYYRFPSDKYPLLLMTWGESYRYRP